MSAPTPFEPVRALHALANGKVEFVVIGGVAARIHGSPSLTRDVDICYARDTLNVDRLATVLRTLHARLRGVDDEVPFVPDGRTLLAGANFTLVTDVGDLDVLAAPAGVGGFDELAVHAASIDLDGVTVLVASLDDLMRMKRSTGRPKDRAELEILAALRDELDAD